MKMLIVAALICTLMALTRADDAAEPKIQNDQRAETELVKRIFWCPSGWKRIRGRCFQYVQAPMHWANAEMHCQRMGGNLASVRNYQEHHEIQMMIFAVTNAYRPAWIGGSDAQQEAVWLWSNGKPFNYQNWCRGQPNNWGGKQHCLTMNSFAGRCWNDDWCSRRKPFVCAKNRW